MDISSFYFYLIYMLILYISFTLVRDRRLFPSHSSGLQLLSSLLAFFGGYLVIRSLGSGHRYGSGTCGSEGCIYIQPLIFTIDEILFVLLLPLLFFTTILALLMVFAEIPRFKTKRMTFEGASIIFAGSLLFVNFIIGGYPGLKFIGLAFLIATLALLVKVQRYRIILGAVVMMYLYPVLYW